MKNIKKFASLLCLLFAASACQNDKGSVLIVTDKENMSANVQEDNSEPDLNDEDDTDSSPTTAFKNLINLANKQLVDTKYLNTNLEYVSSITSLEFSKYETTFCALGDKQDDYNFLIKIKMNHTFENPSDFIYEMTNLKLTNAVNKYGITCEVMNVESGEYINEKLDELRPTVLTQFTDTNPHKHKAYRADHSETYFFSTTYLGTDSKIYSINEMMFDQAYNTLQISSKYTISRSENKKMYELFNLILQDTIN